MGLTRAIFELFVVYLVYKLIFDFIIPVYKTTKQVSEKMSEMQSKMTDHMNNQQSKTSPDLSKESTSRPNKEDYIEFEEVK